MDFAVILIATIVGCFALRNPLKALPVAFYAAAIFASTMTLVA